MKKKIEEILETIWTLKEQNIFHRKDIIQDTDERGVGFALKYLFCMDQSPTEMLDILQHYPIRQNLDLEDHDHLL